jgi:pimeloyl-ACP methyl ester carboxylesterase
MIQPLELAFEERGRGPVLVFIHGFPFDRTMWVPQLTAIASKRTCVAVDLRGHGLSIDDAPSDYSMDLFADDVAATLDLLKAEQADICGMSMGGYVASAFWRRHRARVRSLIFVSTKADADSDDAKAGREKAAEKIAAEGMDVFHGDLGPKLMGDDPPDEVTERVHKMFMACPPEVAVADLLAMRDRADSTPDLAGIDVPVLWIQGEADKIMPVDAARATAEAIPGATFVPIPGAGHMANMERPPLVNDALAAFLP